MCSAHTGYFMFNTIALYFFNQARYCLFYSENYILSNTCKEYN